MFECQLIAMDMDGTLLTSQGAILEETKTALTWAVKNGCKITLSTGRSFQAIKQYRELLPLNAPVILYNGAMVTDLDGTVLFHQTLDAKAAEVILASKLAPKSICIWCRNQLYVPTPTPQTALYEKQAGCKAKPTGSLSELAASGITKILWFDQPESHLERKPLLAKLLPDSVSFYTSKPEYLEFVNSRISKGTALSFLCKHLGITLSQTVAFGDGENDIPLLEAAGLGVAMGNALPSVKEKADMITASNDKNGIGKIFPFIFPHIVLY